MKTTTLISVETFAMMSSEQIVKFISNHRDSHNARIEGSTPGVDRCIIGDRPLERMFIVKITGMQKHITDKEYENSFTSYVLALKDYTRQCQRCGIEDINLNGLELESGGVGYDYRIELYELK